MILPRSSKILASSCRISASSIVRSWHNLPKSINFHGTVYLFIYFLVTSYMFSLIFFHLIHRQDFALIAQTLEENMYNVDMSISYILQMMCVAEEQGGRLEFVLMANS